MERGFLILFLVIVVSADSQQQNDFDINSVVSSDNGYEDDESPRVIAEVTKNENYNSINGEPGVDYPVYSHIPKTTFTCSQPRNFVGYYADIETRCQVFHICQPNGQKTSFLCPNGSIFNQKYSVCDWWYNFDCNETGNDEQLLIDYEIEKITYNSGDDHRHHHHQQQQLNENLFDVNQPNNVQYRQSETPFDLNLAASEQGRQPPPIGGDLKINNGIEISIAEGDRQTATTFRHRMKSSTDGKS